MTASKSGKRPGRRERALERTAEKNKALADAYALIVMYVEPGEAGSIRDRTLTALSRMMVETV